MEAVAATVSVHRPLPAEEAARADFYALLARLLHDAPDCALLQALADAPSIPEEGNAALAAAWRDLSAASAVVDAQAVLEEYHELFIGVGKARLSIYAGYYLGAIAADHPRVRLQADFDALGLGRRAHANEPEDHLAGLLDVMRVLAAGGAGRDRATLQEQKRFFEAYLQGALPPFFNAVIACEKASYYRKVAALGLAFTALESESFELET